MGIHIHIHTCDCTGLVIMHYKCVNMVCNSMKRTPTQTLYICWLSCPLLATTLSLFVLAVYTDELSIGEPYSKALRGAQCAAPATKSARAPLSKRRSCHTFCTSRFTKCCTAPPTKSVHHDPRRAALPVRFANKLQMQSTRSLLTILLQKTSPKFRKEPHVQSSSKFTIHCACDGNQSTPKTTTKFKEPCLPRICTKKFTTTPISCTRQSRLQTTKTPGFLCACNEE